MSGYFSAKKPGIFTVDQTSTKINRVKSACSIHWKVSESDIDGRDRRSTYCNARHCFWIILRDILQIPALQIAKLTDRDHTTILHGTGNTRYHQLHEDIKEILRGMKNGTN